MEYVPPTMNFRRSLGYGIGAALVGLFIVYTLTPAGSLVQRAGLGAVILVVFAFLLMRFRDLKKNGFDERGVYTRGKLLFPWSKVKRIALKFGKEGGSVTRVAQPALSPGRETPVEYRASLVFTLEDGMVVSIPSNLDRIAGNVVERIDALAKLANPRIEFE